MAIKVPGPRLMQNVKLAFVARKACGGGRTVNARLSLTSMIDFLVVTVVFLLMTFSASAQTEHEGLPGATTVVDTIDAPMVALVGSQIVLDGVSIGTTRAIEDSMHLQKIDELADALKAKRALWTQLHPDKPFPGAVVLSIDQNTPAVVVKSIFQTAALAGFPNVSFMVNSVAKR